MATVTKSIGVTSRDYSTITAWEADLDNVAYYSSSDDAVGEMYDDSDFDEQVTINGGSTVGSEDLHLKAQSDAIDAGTDLGTTPSGVEIDINGRDRDSQGDTWDQGAHEFVGDTPPPTGGPVSNWPALTW